MTAAPPRLVPERELPRSTYIPGHTPRPPRGEAAAERPNEATPIEATPVEGPSIDAPPVAPPATARPIMGEFLYGLDLFNHGYYWEAHEVWEDLWHAAGRSGPAADFFKGLIKLAAAGVKAREGSAVGRRRHALRAAELFAQVADGFAGDPNAAATVSATDIASLGLPPRELARLANRAAIGSTRMLEPSAKPAAVFDFVLVPGMK